MKPLTFISFLCFCCCNTPATPRPKIVGDSSNSFSGKVFKSKAVLFFDVESKYIEVNRLSSCEPEMLEDTILVEGVHIDAEIRYSINLKPGEQLQFETPDGIKLWLKEATTIGIHVISKKVAKLVVYGEAFIETPHSINLSTNGKTDFTVNPRSKVNLKNDMVSGQIVISVLKGELQASAKYKNDNVPATSILASKEMVIYKQTAYKIRSFDTTDIAEWRLAHHMRFSEANLITIMASIDNWYKTSTVYDQDNVSYFTDKFDITFPYTMPLDKVLDQLRAISTMKFKRQGDTIYVSTKK